jgi:group I intron endonuclease
MERTKFPYKIYVITSPLGKQYVGITMKSLEHRWRGHTYDAFWEKKSTLLHEAIRLLGKEEFTIKLLRKAKTRYAAGKLEAFFIKKLNTWQPNGYNMAPAGTGCCPGIKRSEETKLKISKNSSLIYNTPEGKEQQRQRALLQNKPTIKAKIKAKLKRIRSTIKYKQAKSIEQKQVWSNPILRKKHSRIMKKQFKNGRITWNKGKKTGLYRGRTLEERKELGWI